MKANIGRNATVSIVLGVISVVGVLLMHLVLIDIWHGEGDLRLEWWVLRICVLTIVAFQVSALFTLFRVVRANIT